MELIDRLLLLSARWGTLNSPRLSPLMLPLHSGNCGLRDTIKFRNHILGTICGAEYIHHRLTVQVGISSRLRSVQHMHMVTVTRGRTPIYGRDATIGRAPFSILYHGGHCHGGDMTSAHVLRAACAHHAHHAQYTIRATDHSWGRITLRFRRRRMISILLIGENTGHHFRWAHRHSILILRIKHTARYHRLRVALQTRRNSSSFILQQFFL
mmetsp:Transcript_24283/g.43773  ORF Transcript_24283/g.43773 Transcript_24283/m.43773 type:complete len:211 (+) Transcript_24283:1573-2205(+)